MKYRKWGLLAFCLLLTACHTGRKPTGEKTTVISPVETIATTEETQSPVIETVSYTHLTLPTKA